MSTQEPTAQELLERHMGAQLVTDEHAAMTDGPGDTKLSEAFAELDAMGATFASSRPGDLRTVGAYNVTPGSARVLKYWKQWITAWYWMSPTAILECDRCGELKLVGSKKSVKCKRDGGTMRAIEPTFSSRRPRARKVKVEV